MNYRKFVHHLLALYVSVVTVIFCSSVEAQNKPYFDFYGSSAIGSNRGFDNRVVDNEYVDTARGILHFDYTDMSIPGDGGFDINIKRWYSSRKADPKNPAQRNIYGLIPGWSMGFGSATIVRENSSCSKAARDNVFFDMPDGGGSERMTSTLTTNFDKIIESNGGFSNDNSGVITLITKNGTQYEMSRVITMAFNSVFYAGCTTQKWLTTKVTDKNGNYAVISYDTVNEVSAVTANDGRTVTYTKALDSSGNVIELKVNFLTTAFTYKYTVFSENPYPIGSEARIMVGSSSYKVLSSTVNQVGEETKFEYETLFRRGSNDYYVSPPSNNEFFGIIKTKTMPNGAVHSYSFQTGTIEQFNDMSTSAIWGAVYQPVLINRKVTDASSNILGQWGYNYTVEGNGFAGPANKMVTSVTTGVDKTIYRHNRLSPLTYSINYDYVQATNANYPYFKGEYYLYGTLASESKTDLAGVVAQSKVYSYTKLKVGAELRRKSIAGISFQDDANYVPILASVVTSRDGVSYATTYSNQDAYGNPQTVSEIGVNGGNRSTSKAYYNDTLKWIIGKPLGETVAGGSAITRTYYPTGDLQSQTVIGVTTSYTYDVQGNRTSITLPRGLTHYYSTFKRGIAQSETQPEGIVISRVVNDSGTVASETNGENKTTTFAYDGLNRITQVTPPIGNAITIIYTPNSKNSARGGLLETTLYDGLGRPTDINLGGISRIFKYDALGRKTFESNPNDSVGVSYAYDAIGRLTRKTNPDATFSTMSYGAGTRTVTNELGHTTTTAYRSYGNPDEQYAMSITAPVASANVVMERNLFDQIASATQGGIKRTYAYDTRSYLRSVTDPETGTTTYERDNANNVLSSTIGGLKNTYVYDGQNNLKIANYPAANGLAEFSVNKTYSKTNKLKTVSSSTASRAYEYNGNDSLTGESLVVDGLTFAIGYGYNSNDQLATLVYPSIGGATARIINFEPDGLGRPTTASGVLTNVNYYPSGQLKQLDYANGFSTTYGQNNRLWPSSFTTAKAGVLTINNGYGYDGTGNLLAVADTIDGNYNRTLGFDGINRIIAASGAWGTGTFTYDGAGNLKSQSFSGKYIGYSYDSSNRLASTVGDKAASYGYDTQGNIASDTAAANAVGTSNYAYDGANNLRCINCASTNQTALPTTEYGYDGLNQRVWIKKAGNKTYEIYNSAGLLLTEYTPATASTKDNIYFGTKHIGTSDPKGIWVPPVEYFCPTSSKGGPIYYCKPNRPGYWMGGYVQYHLDPAGTPLMASDSNGNVKWKETYLPYGEKYQPSVAAGDNTIGFAGKPYDNVTGLSYMGARYYNPTLGRFTGIDPVGFNPDNLHSHNRYAYANNNPYKYVDPDGRVAFLAAVSPAIAYLTPIAYGIAARFAASSVYRFGMSVAIGETGFVAPASLALGAGKVTSVVAKEAGNSSVPTMAKTADLIATHGRTMSNKEFDRLSKNIGKEGVKETITITEHNGKPYILDGHHRVEAATKRGVSEVPVNNVDLPWGPYKNPSDLNYVPGGY